MPTGDLRFVTDRNQLKKVRTIRGDPAVFAAGGAVLFALHVMLSFLFPDRPDFDLDSFAPVDHFLPFLIMLTACGAVFSGFFLPFCRRDPLLEAELTGTHLVLRFHNREPRLSYAGLDVSRLRNFGRNISLLYIRKIDAGGVEGVYNSLDHFDLFVTELRRRVENAGGVAGGPDADARAAMNARKNSLRLQAVSALAVLAAFAVQTWQKRAAYEHEVSIRHAGTAVEATVVSIWSEREAGTRPVYAFTDAKGIRHERMADWLPREGFGRLRQGDTLPVRHDPADPEASRVPGETIQPPFRYPVFGIALVVLCFVWLMRTLRQLTRSQSLAGEQT